MTLCQFPGPGLKKLATSTFYLLEHSLWRKPELWKKSGYTDTTMLWRSPTQTHGKREILSCHGRTIPGTKQAIIEATLEIPTLADVPWRKTEVQTCDLNWVTLVIFSCSNWSPTPLGSRDKPFLMCTATAFRGSLLHSHRQLGQGGSTWWNIMMPAGANFLSKETRGHPSSPFISVGLASVAQSPIVYPCWIY